MLVAQREGRKQRISCSSKGHGVSLAELELKIEIIAVIFMDQAKRVLVYMVV